MSQKSLEDRLQAAGGPLKMLRESQTGPYVYPVVPPEYSNWRDEQRAWRETCILFNQSYHMTDMYVEGPDAPKLLEHLGVNTFKNFGPNKAKQYVPVNYDGYVIGDVVLFHLEQNRFNLVGRPPVHNWVQYHAETGKYDVKLERDERTVARTGPNAGVRKVYRYQVQGPNALKVMEKVTGKVLPEVKFFNMAEFTIAGKRVRALRHGMVGQPGFELFGPWDDGEAVKAAIVEAGQEFGIKLSGSRTYSSNTLESGWIPSPMPAVYSGDKMKAFRQWLPATSFEGIASLGGSFSSSNIEDYYLTPYDLGYGPVVKFDHDFIGREALEKIAANPAPQEGHAGAQQRRRAEGHLDALWATPADEVLRVPLCGLLDTSLRQGGEGRQGHRRLDLVRLQLERREDADAGHDQHRAQRAGHRSHVRVG